MVLKHVERCSATVAEAAEAAVVATGGCKHFVLAWDKAAEQLASSGGEMRSRRAQLHVHADRRPRMRSHDMHMSGFGHAREVAMRIPATLGGTSRLYVCRCGPRQRPNDRR